MRRLSHSARVCARLVAGALVVLCALAVRSDRVSTQANLVAAWPFNEGTGSTSDDRSPNDHVATLNGATWATGKYGAGLIFDGGDDLVGVADAPALDLTSAFTIEAWIYPDVSTAVRPIVHKAAASGDAYALSLTTQSKARAEVTIGGTTYGVTGNTFLTDLAWTHLAATYNGAQLKIWVNGDLDGSATVSGSIAATTGTLSIGGDAVANTWFDGAIDEVRLYDVALTETQIESDLDTSIDDLTAPTISSASPASGTINVHPGSAITITFSESLDPLTVTSSTIELRDAGNTLVSGTVGYDDPSHTATFTPSAALAQTAAYTVTVRGGATAPVVKDVAGNAFAATASWGFTTADIAPPTVTVATPAANTRNVSLSATIQATFSEPINASTLTGSTFVVKDTRNVAIAGAITYDAPTQTATFTPSAPLLPTRAYTVTLAGGVSGSRVEDLSGNALTANYTWSFVTTVEPSRLGAGLNHSVAVDDAGQVWTWGSDTFGERGTDLDGKSPGAVTAASSGKAVAAGEYHTLALKTDGTLLAWGYNFEGQLGDNSQTNRTTPVAVSTLTNVIAIAAGRVHSVALKNDGTVWTWGAAGLIGDGQSVRRLTPVQVTSLTDVIAIAAGGDHTLALKGDGTVWSWGTNTYGQLGDGTTTARLSPVQVSSLSGVVGVAAGNRHSLAILSDLTAKAWGANYSGQIGDGTTTSPRTSPTSVSSLSDVRSLNGGQDRSLASRLDGSTRIWGSTGTGNATTPTTVSGDPASWQIASGGFHTLLVTGNGLVSAVAHSAPAYGQLGDGTTVQPSTAIVISDAAYAWKVATPEFNVASGTYNVVKVVTVTVVTSGATIHYTLNGVEPTESDPTVASGSTVTIDESHTLKAKAWKSGRPASNVASATYTLQVATVVFSPFATTYTTAQNVTMSTSSPGATIRYTTDGSTPTESSPAYSGAIAVGTFTAFKAIGFRTNWQPSPMNAGTYSFNYGTLVAPTLDPVGGTYTSQAVVTMSAMSGATIRYTTDGSTPSATSPIYTGPVTVSATQTLKARAFHVDWTTSGTTTQAYTIVVATPTLSPTSGTYAASQTITVSTATSGATLRYTLNGLEPTTSDPTIASGGTLQVGNYTLKVKAFKTGATTSATTTGTYQVTGQYTTPRIAGGLDHSLAIRDDGVMFAWGGGGAGQLGTGGTARQLLPVVVNGVTGATRAAAGQYFSLAAGSGQQPWSWGTNGNGQLGDNSTTTRLVPVQPTSLASVVSVSAGVSHALALKADGTLVGWGANSNGQIGDGTTTQRLTAVAVSTLTNVTDVVAANGFSLAVKSDGTAWSWGNNGNGQLGTGNTTSRSTPGTVSGITTAVAVAGGSAHSLALLGDGTVRAWGFNGSGQLGDGTQMQRTSPVAVSNLSNVTAIAAGESHSLALDSSGVVCGIL